MRYVDLTWSREASRRMDERDVDEEVVLIVIERGEIVEEIHRPGRELSTRVYLDHVDGRPIHVVVGHDGAAARGHVVTTYEPTLDRWEPGFRERRR
jgi:hypothetical protein